jgi:hypothetical protein
MPKAPIQNTLLYGVVGFMKNYHASWLAAHPDRSPEWLAERLDDGFEVHHIDGNRSNSHHSNLVLIDELDHSMLHRDKRNLRVTKKAIRGLRPETIELGRVAYRTRAEGHRWEDVRNIMAASVGHRSLWKPARAYANLNGLPWPVPLPDGITGHIGHSKYRRFRL